MQGEGFFLKRRRAKARRRERKGPTTKSDGPFSPILEPGFELVADICSIITVRKRRRLSCDICFI